MKITGKIGSLTTNQPLIFKKLDAVR